MIGHIEPRAVHISGNVHVAALHFNRIASLRWLSPIVAAIVKPRRRRRLSAENRRKAVERLAKFRFHARTPDGKNGAESRSGVRA